MKPISTFFPRLLPYLTGCTEPLAQQVLVDSAIAFCEDTQVIRAELDEFQTRPGENAYELEAPSQQQVARVLDVKVSGRTLTAVVAEDVDLLMAAVGTPMAYYTDRTDSQFTLRLFPKPDGEYAVKVRAALRPMRTATAVEDDLFDLWSDAVICGALSRAMNIPGQPFSDPAGAAYHMSMAINASRKARLEGNYGRIRGNSRVRGVPFA